MRDIQPAESYADTVRARSPRDPEMIVKVGIRHSTFRQFEFTRQATKVAQYYGNVQEGLVEARHAFRGLRRPHEYDGDMRADEKVTVYSWRAECDWVWVRSRFEGFAERRTPPPGFVFVVLVQEEEANEQGLVGSIAQWNWVAEDPKLPYAPLYWENRYSKRLWSR